MFLSYQCCIHVKELHVTHAGTKVLLLVPRLVSYHISCVPDKIVTRHSECSTLAKVDRVHKSLLAPVVSGPHIHRSCLLVGYYATARC